MTHPTHTHTQTHTRIHTTFPQDSRSCEGPCWSRIKLWQGLLPFSVSAVIKWVPLVSSTQEIGPVQPLSLLSVFSVGGYRWWKEKRWWLQGRKKKRINVKNSGHWEARKNENGMVAKSDKSRDSLDKVARATCPSRLTGKWVRRGGSVNVTASLLSPACLCINVSLAEWCHTILHLHARCNLFFQDTGEVKIVLRWKGSGVFGELGREVEMRKWYYVRVTDSQYGLKSQRRQKWHLLPVNAIVKLCGKILLL